MLDTISVTERCNDCWDDLWTLRLRACPTRHKVPPQ